jgi:hypothetical protein
MITFPGFMWLGGDKNGDVWMICDHCSSPSQPSLAHYGGYGEEDAQGLPHFSTRQLDEFFAFARKHADEHRGGQL